MKALDDDKTGYGLGYGGTGRSGSGCGLYSDTYGCGNEYGSGDCLGSGYGIDYSLHDPFLVDHTETDGTGLGWRGGYGRLERDPGDGCGAPEGSSDLSADRSGRHDYGFGVHGGGGGGFDPHTRREDA